MTFDENGSADKSRSKEIGFCVSNLTYDGA
jgi:hypothetical protein